MGYCVAGKTTKGEYNNAGNLGNPSFYKHGSGYEAELLRTEQTLTEPAKIRRRLFAQHYIKTTNATESAKFAKFKSPGVKGARLLKEPYVKALIHAMLDELDKDAVMSQNEILFKLKEEANNLEARNQGARISALAHMAKIQGMMVEKQEVMVTTTGVMVVPAMGSADEWGEAAAKAQEELKNSVRD